MEVTPITPIYVGRSAYTKKVYPLIPTLWGSTRWWYANHRAPVDEIKRQQVGKLHALLELDPLDAQLLSFHVHAYQFHSFCNWMPVSNSTGQQTEACTTERRPIM